MRKRTRAAINGKIKQKFVNDNGKVSEIRKRKKKKTLFDAVRAFINSKEDGYIITRTELIHVIYETKPKNGMLTTDLYRADLTKLGFLKTVEPGRYKKLYNIPEELTISKIREVIKNKSNWRGWFMKLHDQLGIPENKCPKVEQIK
jgi:hypothetical protein